MARSLALERANLSCLVGLLTATHLGLGGTIDGVPVDFRISVHTVYDGRIPPGEYDSVTSPWPIHVVASVHSWRASWWTIPAGIST